MKPDPHKQHLHELAEQVASAEYRMDPRAVADAIVRRRWSVAIVPELAPVSAIGSRGRTRARVQCVTRDTRRAANVLAA